jgi:hypothetical protein
MEEEYREIVEKMLFGLGKELDDKRIDYIIDRINSVNKLVLFANDNLPQYKLRSTQVIAYIVYDCMMESGYILL